MSGSKENVSDVVIWFSDDRINGCLILSQHCSRIIWVIVVSIDKNQFIVVRNQFHSHRHISFINFIQTSQSYVQSIHNCSFLFCFSSVPNTRLLRSEERRVGKECWYRRLRECHKHKVSSDIYKNQ